MPDFELGPAEVVQLGEAEKANLAVLELIDKGESCGIDCVRFREIAQANIDQLRALRDNFGPKIAKTK